MSSAINHPCDEELIRSTRADAACSSKAGPWVLAATMVATAAALASALGAAPLIEGKRPDENADESDTNTLAA